MSRPPSDEELMEQHLRDEGLTVPLSAQENEDILRALEGLEEESRRTAQTLAYSDPERPGTEDRVDYEEAGPSHREPKDSGGSKKASFAM